MPKKTGTFDQQKYINEYNREHIVYRKMSFNLGKPEDLALLEWIDSKQGTSGYLKRLIAEDRAKHTKEKTPG